MVSISDDAELARAARHGNRAAFGRLYDRYLRMVHGILLARVPYGEVDDLVQDVFVQALPRLGALREAAKFPGWLAAIARNRATDYHRQARPAEHIAEEEGEKRAGARAPSAPGTTQANAEARAVLEAIVGLPEAYRETLILRLVEGMTGPEIAEKTGLTHGSVRVNLHRGMQLLREMLGRRAKSLTGSET